MVSDASSSVPESSPPVRRRGRPPRNGDLTYGATRDLVIRAGLAMLTEKGYSAVGLDEILRSVKVPKGSFYHYFKSKEDFGRTLIAEYDGYFSARLDRFLLNADRAPPDRLWDFVEDAKQGMARHGFRRGCLVGNLGQEMSSLPESFRQALTEVFLNWQGRTVACLRAAQEAGALAADEDCAALAEFFWIGWEGAVLRARLEQRADPLDLFARGFFRSLGLPFPTPPLQDKR